MENIMLFLGNPCPLIFTHLRIVPSQTAQCLIVLRVISVVIDDGLTEITTGSSQ